MTIDFAATKIEQLVGVGSVDRCLYSDPCVHW